MLCVNPLTGTKDGAAPPQANPGTLVPTADMTRRRSSRARSARTATRACCMLDGDDPGARTVRAAGQQLSRLRLCLVLGRDPARRGAEAAGLAALITSSAAEFAERCRRRGKLAGLDVGTKTIGLAHLRRGLALRGTGGDHPPDQVHRRSQTADGSSRERIRRPAWSSACRSTWTAATRPRTQSVRAFARNLAPLGPADPAVGRALVDAGRRAGDDRRGRQPGQARREGRRPRRRPHPARRDRCAGQSAAPRLGGELVDLISIDSLTDAQIERSSIAASAGSSTIARTARAGQEPARQTRLQPLLRKLDAHRDVLRRRRAPARRLAGDAAGRAVLDQEGRNARRHCADAKRHAAGLHRHPPPREWRAGASGASLWTAPVINAGDGTNEHPTQALAGRR